MDISSEQKKSLEALREKHGLRLVLLFGSQAGGAIHAASDLDIAVQSLHGGGLSTRAWLDLLDDLRGVFPDQSVDLAVVDRADPLFLKQITGRCSLLAGRERDYHELRLYAFRRYQDHKPYLAMERRFVKSLVGAGAGNG
jgi:predicted nucleotidyltransferase